MKQLQTYLAAHLIRYLDDLRTLVGIDSGSDDKAGVDSVVAWLAARLSTLGFAVNATRSRC
jgi:acetylornithine deacetylase/succinyl-diaminopimelate desuccinylase-like protein